jgi:oxalate decarboxylase/phosphoglucose isomerase-like protein (cupin superfamily)
MNASPSAAFDRRTAYDRYIDEEGIPVVEDFHLRDLSRVEVAPWKRTGALGAFVRLEGAQMLDDSYVLEIPPAAQTVPQRHLYEELVYVVRGSGSTMVWNNHGAKVSFEWQAGSLFAIPLNTYYQHFNASGAESARCYSVTNAPLMMNLIHDQDFIFGLDYDFTDRFDPGRSDFSGAGTAYEGRIWDTNFVPDVRTVELQDWKERGAGGRNILFEIADGIMCGHISQFPVGTYKKAHRHTAGAHVIILSGEGFSLLWPEGKPMRRVDWGPGSVVVPPDQWFHQHFNTGDTPARYLALRFGSKKHPVFPPSQLDKPTSEGGTQIEYADEDPAVRHMFEEDLDRKGVRSQMDQVISASRR